MELDQKEKLNSSRIRDLEATVKKLEKENSKLKENEVDPPITEDIGIQKNEENAGSDEKELLLQETIDGLNAKIFQIQSDHEKELEMIMRDKRIVQPEILIPKELTIIDQSDLGKSDKSDHQIEVESISTFWQSRIDDLHIQLQKEIARAQYSSSESKSAMIRLRRAEDERHDLIGQLRKSRDDKKEVENEMETIKRSYEQQLNTMTEELALQLANGSAGHNSTGSAVEEEAKSSNKKSRFSLFSRNNS